jgi:hypothetical protein
MTDEINNGDKEDIGNKFGLSRKSNVAIAAITGITMTKDSWIASIAIVVVALFTIASQHYLDKNNIDDSY